MAPTPLKELLFDAARFRQVATELTAIHPDFDAARFLALALPGLDALNLMPRLRRMTESLHATLPSDYAAALGILYRLAPRIDRRFVTLVLPDYVALHGRAHFQRSMDALEFFTPFGSAEFAVRAFLRDDLARTLAVMERWSRHPDEHVRRLASEGCRPRLPWSFRLNALVADPSPVAPILENLRNDPSLYVRKSVANHLNDITKDHPTWVLDRLEAWPLGQPATAWIAKRALRTLIKKGDRRALGFIGAGAAAQVLAPDFAVEPRRIALGDRIALSCRLQSCAAAPQRLVVDYAVHYVKKSGVSAAKVFKWKEITLAAGESLALTRTQRIQNFTTRVHHPGRHEVELFLNGESIARDFFVLAA